MDRANNIFDQIDTDKSGGIDKGEITIHLLSYCSDCRAVRPLGSLSLAASDPTARAPAAPVPLAIHTALRTLRA